MQNVAVVVFALLELHETVVVPCAVSGSMPTTAQWFSWSKLDWISDDTKSRITVDLATGDMTVHNFSNIDGGRYYCIVTYGEDQRVVFTHHLIGLSPSMHIIQHYTLLLLGAVF